MAKPKAERKFETQLSSLANTLRKTSTLGEKKVWFELQKLRLSTNVRFRRQQPIGKYIADFYCVKHKCAIEIDGTSHDSKIEKDKNRDVYFENIGIKTFRFTETEARQNPSAILDTVLSFLNLPTPPLTPPSRGGELHHAIGNQTASSAKDSAR